MLGKLGIVGMAAVTVGILFLIPDMRGYFANEPAQQYVGIALVMIGPFFALSGR